MVHRDIKPRNLMLERRDNGSEKLYLTDFGITKKLATHTLMVSKIQPAAKDEKAALGTLPYMSWQQLEDEAPKIYDDIYSVGATIYDLITGRPPFYEGSYDQIRHQIEKGTPPSMEARLEAFSLPNLGIPTAWEEVVRDCLLKDPGARPKTAREISERLGLIKTAPVTLVSKEAVPVGSPVREAELERELAARDAEVARIAEEKERDLAAKESEVLQLIEAKDQALAEREAEIARLAGEKETDLASKDAELLRLVEEKDLALAEKEAEAKRLIDEKDQQLKTREAELTRLSQEKDELIQSLTDQLSRLNDSIASGDEASTHLKTELDLLRQSMTGKEEEVSHLRNELEQVRQNARLEGNEALNALQNSLDQKNDELHQLLTLSDARQVQLDETLGVLEQERTRLSQLEAELETARSEFATAAKEIEDLRSAATLSQTQLEEARQASEQERARIAELEASLQATQAEHAGAATKIQEIQGIASHNQARLDDALRASEQEKARIAQLEAHLKATQAEQAAAAKQIEEARKAAANAVAEKESSSAKAKQLVEKSEARLKELKERQSAPLVPLLMTLVGAFIVGIIGGGALGKLLPASKSETSQIASFDFNSHAGEIPADADQKASTSLVSVGLFRQFALSSGVLEEDLDNLVPDLSTLDESEPIRGVTYSVAESFCAWLTAQDPLGVIGNSRSFYRIPRLNELPSEAGRSFSEWTSTTHVEAGVDAKKIVDNGIENPWLVRSWGKTIERENPLSFRVILDEGN